MTIRKYLASLITSSRRGLLKASAFSVIWSLQKSTTSCQPQTHSQLKFTQKKPNFVFTKTSTQICRVSGHMLTEWKNPQGISKNQMLACVSILFSEMSCPCILSHDTQRVLTRFEMVNKEQNLRKDKHKKASRSKVQQLP